MSVSLAAFHHWRLQHHLRGLFDYALLQMPCKIPFSLHKEFRTQYFCTPGPVCALCFMTRRSFGQQSKYLHGRRCTCFSYTPEQGSLVALASFLSYSEWPHYFQLTLVIICRRTVFSPHGDICLLNGTNTRLVIESL